MKNILKKIKINNYTYLFILICFLCGFIKNIIIIFTICIFHELGHILFIKVFKYKIVSIELLPFGGYTKIDKMINTNINKDLIISFGGILFQLIIFLLLYIFKDIINIITYNLYYSYNLYILLFNLIPIIPLDGSNILHLLLEKLFPYELSYKVLGYISILTLIIFIIINYIYRFNNYFIISFLIYKIIEYYKNYKYLRNRFFLERIIYNFEYNKINNNTKDIKNIKKEVYHYFKYNNMYINERNKILKDYLYNSKI